MFRKLSIFIMFTALVLTENTVFCGANGENVGSVSDEVLVMKKDTPTAVTAPASVTTAAVPAEITATAAPAVTATAKPEPTPKPKKKKTAVKQAKTPAVVKATEAITPERKKINDLVERIKQKQEGRKGMTCDIVMKTSAAGSPAAQDSKARVVIKKKDKFFVHFTSPAEQFLISNGKWLWIYTVEAKQVLKQAAKDASFDVKFYIEIEKQLEYYVRNSDTKMTEDDKEYTLVMTPYDRKKLDYSEITAKVARDGLLPLYMSMKSQDMFTEVIFSDIKNYTAEEAASVAELADKNFEFKTPEGVEEIEASALIDSATK